MKQATIFQTERDLCGAFEDFALRRGFEVHREPPGNFDFLLIQEVDGELIQWGVHGKLHARLAVIRQTVTGMRQPQGPQIACVLVPIAPDDFRWACAEFGLTLAVPNLVASRLDKGEVEFDVYDPHPFNRHPAPPERATVPRFANETPAGVPSPRKIGPNQEKELRLCKLYRDKGFVNSKDFARCDINKRFPPRWLWHSGHNKWELKDGVDLPDLHHPVAAKVLAKEMRE